MTNIRFHVLTLGAPNPVQRALIVQMGDHLWHLTSFHMIHVLLKAHVEYNIHPFDHLVVDEEEQI